MEHKAKQLKSIEDSFLLSEAALCNAISQDARGVRGNFQTSCFYSVDPIRLNFFGLRLCCSALFGKRQESLVGLVN